eukprot:SAG11_NODE_1805_length_4229_cov_1.746005_4_plen_282_part_00
MEVTFKDMIDICEFSNARSFMCVGCEIRHYHIGTPMGEQGSCAKANGLCLNDELLADEARELSHGDSERNLSLAFVDDKHVRVAYDDILWTRESAEEIADGLMQYTAPLLMTTEPPSEPTPFHETAVHNPTGDGRVLRTTHKQREWRVDSYRICRLGVAGTLDQQVATAAATFMRILDNSTQDQDATYSVALEMQEMILGAGWSRSATRAAFERLTRQRHNVERSRRLVAFASEHKDAVYMHLQRLLSGAWQVDRKCTSMNTLLKPGLHNLKNSTQRGMRV